MAKVATVEACRFIVDCLHAAGANRESAEQQAKLLIQSDKFGHPSHGMNRLGCGGDNNLLRGDSLNALWAPYYTTRLFKDREELERNAREFYVNDILKGVCKPNNKPVILKQTVSTAWIDAKNVLGATASHFAMDIAIAKAKKTGVGWVTVKGSNHNGIAGYWAQKAADAGMIGMAFTNTPPIMAPTRSKEAALGTNPIAVVARASDGESFYLDMATTAVALGKIEIQQLKGEPIPPGWAQGPDGHETRDPDLAYKTRRLYPLGGVEKTSGYKGYGLGAMVELLTGITAGAKYGHHITMWFTDDCEPADIGHCFVAIDPGCFAPGFGDRLAECIQHWRDLDPVDPNRPVFAPGDKEKIAACVAEKSGSVEYLPRQIEKCRALAEKLKIPHMRVINEQA